MVDGRKWRRQLEKLMIMQRSKEGFVAKGSLRLGMVVRRWISVKKNCKRLKEVATTMRMTMHGQDGVCFGWFLVVSTLSQDKVVTIMVFSVNDGYQWVKMAVRVKMWVEDCLAWLLKCSGMVDWR